MNEKHDNKHIKIYTRGDGYYGRDVTPFLRFLNINLNNLDKIYEKYGNFAIRGELIM
jgi:hypothetical protein